jgi:hypothetical protein
MLRAALLAAAGLVCSAAASAVLLAGPDGAGHVAPFDQPIVANIGVRGCCSAIYLGRGIVLTANHVGPGEVVFAGGVHPYLPGTEVRIRNADGTDADLLIFEVYPRPDLPALDLPAASPAPGSPLLSAGNGVNRGDPLIWDPNGASAPGPTSGYAWASGSNVRWGNNDLEVYPAGGRVFNTYAFGSNFDDDRTLAEAQAVIGDSGGAVFALGSGGWNLAGVILGIVQYSGQPANTSFFGQRTWYADLAYYRLQLESAVAMPESDRTLAPALVLLGWLAGRRRRTAASGRAAADAPLLRAR